MLNGVLLLNIYKCNRNIFRILGILEIYFFVVIKDKDFFLEFLFLWVGGKIFRLCN